jgi:hypothetical protein
MKLHRYNQFINEGIISKGLELLNYKTVKENDKIAQKYLKMVYDNYNKHKNLMAVKIAINSGHTTLWYKISEDPYTQAGTGGGEFPDYIEVEITSINQIGWSSDITRARIEVEKDGKKMIGRDMDTNKTIESESGIDKDVYTYLNISQSQVDKMIKFFKSEYIKKYPEMMNFKSFNYWRILEIDKELKKSLESNYKESRKRYEDNKIQLENKFKDFINQNAKFDHEEINDYFIDLIDHMSDTIYEKPSIGIGTIIDDKFVHLVKKIDSSFFKDGVFYSRKLDNIQGIKPGKIYYYLNFNIPDNQAEDIIGVTLNYEKIVGIVEKFIESEYHLSTDEKKNTNGTFRLVDIGDDHELFRSSFLKKKTFIILIEQK